MEPVGIERIDASSIQKAKDSNYLMDEDDILESNDRYSCRWDEELNRVLHPNRQLLVRLDMGFDRGQIRYVMAVVLDQFIAKRNNSS